MRYLVVAALFFALGYFWNYVHPWLTPVWDVVKRFAKWVWAKLNGANDGKG